MDRQEREKHDAALPECFGRMDQVFPMGDSGLRESPAECLACARKTDCLRRAMAGPEGMELKMEMVSRDPDTGLRGVLKRWSLRKTLSRQKKNTQG